MTYQSGGITMLKVKESGQFKIEYKRCVERGLNMNLLKSIVATLAILAALPIKNQDHDLKGSYIGFKECHIMPNCLLIYRYNGNIQHFLGWGHIQIYLMNKKD